MQYAASGGTDVFLQRNDRSHPALAVMAAHRRLRHAAICMAPIALLAAWPAQPAFAQISGQASIASDNTFRGVSLNDERPTASLELDYDSPDGWFVAGLATQARLFTQRSASAQFIADAGYAHTLASGLTWELGATRYSFPKVSFYNYTEVFAGLSSHNWNARLYYAPDYFGRNRRTLYAEFNYVQPLDARWRLLGHLGYLRDGLGGQTLDIRTLDASAGLGAKIASFDIQLKWVATNRPTYFYPVATADGRSEWVASVGLGW
jgi:uncharacterized protein (TIGR02001 family)